MGLLILCKIHLTNILEQEHIPELSLNSIKLKKNPSFICSFFSEHLRQNTQIWKSALCDVTIGPDSSPRFVPIQTCEGTTNH